MPEVCRFYGIIIRFYYREHPPTHFHAIYGEQPRMEMNKHESKVGEPRMTRISRMKKARESQIVATKYATDAKGPVIFCLLIFSRQFACLVGNSVRHSTFGFRLPSRSPAAAGRWRVILSRSL